MEHRQHMPGSGAQYSSLKGYESREKLLEVKVTTAIMAMVFSSLSLLPLAADVLDFDQHFCYCDKPLT